MIVNDSSPLQLPAFLRYSVTILHDEHYFSLTGFESATARTGTIIVVESRGTPSKFDVYIAATKEARYAIWKQVL